MRWQTGIVMEKIGRHVVLMTPKGEFKRIKINGRIPDIGEEISVRVTYNRLFNLPRASWLAVAAAVILLMVASPLLTILNQPPEVAVAYISIDINPSIELTVSNYDNVLDAHAYNLDGEKVLAGVRTKGVKYNIVVSEIGRRAVNLGYITKSHDNTFVISVSPLLNAKVDKVAMERTLLASANAALSDSEIKSDVQTIHIPAGIRDTANKRGISSAKYAVLLEAVNAGLPVTEKDMQEKSIKVAIASVGGRPDQIINQAHEENRFEDKEQRYFAILSDSNRSQTNEQVGEQNSSNAAVISAVDENGSNLGEKPDESSDKASKNNSPLIEPIRKNGGPEDSRQTVPADDDGQKPGAVIVSPPSASSDVNNPTGEPKPEIDNNSNNTNSNTSDQTNDQNTDNNYMGQPNQDDPINNTNEDMNVLKPNF